MMKKWNVKQIWLYIVESFLVFGLLSALSIVFTVGIENADLRNRSRTEVSIVGTAGLKMIGESWKSYNEDPSITIAYQQGNIIELDIHFIDETNQYGTIYYADDPINFSEEHVIPYCFKEGKNVIVVDDEYAEYLRLDITQNENVVFQIHTFQEVSPIEYTIKNTNYVLMAILAIIFVVLQICIMKCKYKKIDVIFWTVLIGSLFVIFSKFICVKGYYMYSGIGADTINQYYPYYLNEVISIRNGTFSVWNWNYGLGTSILNVNAWTMDPFGILLVIFGVIFGPGTVQVMLVWMQIAKIVTLFVLGKKYLQFFLTDRLSLNIASYLLAMNGYIMLWGQHYFLGTACIFAVALLCAIEHYLHNDCKKGGVWIVLSVAWTLVYSYYIGYMILAVCAVYFLFRYFFGNRKVQHVKNILKELGKTVYLVVTGVLISGFVFVPACYYVMTNSPRLNNASDNIFYRIFKEFVGSFNFDDFSSRLSRLLSNNVLYIENNTNAYFYNYYEAPILFCTVLVFFFLVQWIIYEIGMAKKENGWLSFTIKIILLYLLTFNSVSGFVLNGFAYAAYRYTFLIFPFISLGIGIVFQEVILKNKISFLGIEIATVLSAWAWGYSFLNCSREVMNYVEAVGIILLIGRCVFVVIWKSDKKKQYMMSALVVIVVFSTVLDNWITTQDRNYVAVDDFSLEWDESELSVASADAVEWIRQQDKSFYRIEKNYIDFNIYSDSIIEGYSSVTWYNSTPNTALVNFYNNIYISANTSMESVKMFQLNTELDQKANDIVNTKYLLSINEMDNDDWKLINVVSGIYIYQNQNSDNIAKWYSKMISKKEFETLGEDEKAEVLADTVVVDSANVKNLNVSSTVIEPFTLSGQTSLHGKVDCTDEGILMVAVPEQNGWEVYVDGKRKESINCDYGFLGVFLENGSHEVSVEYSVPLSKEGICASILGVILLMIYLRCTKKVKSTLMKPRIMQDYGCKTP